MKPDISKSISKIPSSPGCYLYKDINGTIIYIGKAKNLQKRVSSYFAKEHDGKTELLVKEIQDIDFIATQNEKEALFLESNLVKKHQPKYNILLKDGKRFAYIKFTKENLPRMLTARIPNDNATYIGPFSSGESRQEAMRLARRLFGIREVKKETKKKQTLVELNRSLSPLFKYESEKQYQENVKKAILFLSKKTDELITQLKEDMVFYSQQKNYEAAKSARDKINAITALSEKQNVELKNRFDKDIIASAQNEKEILFMIFHLKKGILLGKDEFRFKLTEFNLSEQDEGNDFSDFLMQYYDSHKIPSEIILGNEFEGKELLQEYLQEKSERKFEFVIPKKGDNLELLELVKKNAILKLNKKSEGLYDIKEFAKLKEIPNIIECFDVSNISGTNATGSMVQFLDGKPNKNEYRRFKIITKGPDDFRMIKEIVYRRYKSQLDEKKSLPNLIIIDGGKGQLKFAKSALNLLKLDIPIVGLAKKEETLIFPNGAEHKLNLAKKGSRLIQQIRNESHRFALKYHRHLREKTFLENN